MGEFSENSRVFKKHKNLLGLNNKKKQLSKQNKILEFYVHKFSRNTFFFQIYYHKSRERERESFKFDLFFKIRKMFLFV
jgi:hypothetical protein